MKKVQLFITQFSSGLLLLSPSYGQMSQLFDENWVFFFLCKAAAGLESASVFTLSSSLTPKDVNSIICTIISMEEEISA